MEIYYVACFMAVTVAQIESLKIESKITEYFASDIVKKFQDNWVKYQKPLENAILRAVKENYGYKAMNVYVRRMQDPYKLAKGYYHSDNQVQITLLDLELDDVPYFWMPEVTFSLPSNTLKIGASLSKTIIRSSYVAFRNKSDILYDMTQQSFYENSPFRFQQVQSKGQLGIIIEGCVITGLCLATLSGSSVNLGFNSFSLNKCQYTFEISTPGTGSPPVVAKYYPMGNGLNIQHLLLKSLKEELLPKLQASMFSFVNTSAIFGDDLPVLRQKQEDLFRNTTKYMNDVVRNLNLIAMEKNSGVVDMADFKLFWNDSFEGKPANSEIYLSNMVLSGLETAYSSHVGGPYTDLYVQISEEIRFSILRVRGNIAYQSDRKYEYNFVAELQDVAVEVLLNTKLLQQRRQLVHLKPAEHQHLFYVTGWRNLELSIPRVHLMYADALVTGFLQNSVPKYIMDHLNVNFNKALENAANNKLGKLNLGPKPTVDSEEVTSEVMDSEVIATKDKKAHYKMTSDGEGTVHVEHHSVENKSTPNKTKSKENLIYIYDDVKKPLIGNEDEMVIVSDESSSNESKYDSSVKAESRQKAEPSRNEVGTDK